ncbi:MAG: hypothetical protein GAK29_01430 [Acinetobacter bereziniae]|uniref:Uncharacterized protein n=1 Tax=Acinetobacter bereziniae TaxID=106648 RepID=A0A833TZF5_ACIBZ|nr:MAG: hypothetical protein GAK29_01430 [Acinetobacter bereziniae]
MIKYESKIIAQNDLGRTWVVIQTIEHVNGDVSRNNLFTSEHKNNKGLLECEKMIRKMKSIIW